MQPSLARKPVSHAEWVNSSTYWYIRKHRFKAPLNEVCKDEVILRKYFGWEEAVYFQVVVGQMVVEHLEKELTYLKAAYST